MDKEYKTKYYKPKRWAIKLFKSQGTQIEAITEIKRKEFTLEIHQAQNGKLAHALTLMGDTWDKEDGETTLNLSLARYKNGELIEMKHIVEEPMYRVRTDEDSDNEEDS